MISQTLPRVRSLMQRWNGPCERAFYLNCWIVRWEIWRGWIHLMDLKFVSMCLTKGGKSFDISTFGANRVQIYILNTQRIVGFYRPLAFNASHPIHRPTLGHVATQWKQTPNKYTNSEIETKRLNRRTQIKRNQLINLHPEYLFIIVFGPIRSPSFFIRFVLLAIKWLSKTFPIQ